MRGEFRNRCVHDTPLVSILLPLYRASRTIDACLRSVRRQTWTRWECVVVDDGSDDGSTDIARAHAAHDDRITVVRREHEGIVPALTAGLPLCRGSYVARMDADDVMHRLRLEDQVSLLERRPELAAVGCRVRMFPRHGVGPGLREYEAWLNAIDSDEAVLRDRFIECPIAHPTLVARRDRLVAFGYRDRGWPEDYDLVLRMLEAGCRIDVLNRRRLAWRHGPGRLSLGSDVYRDNRFTECKAWFLARSFLAERERYLLWGYGGTGRALSRALARLGKLPSHVIELHPGRLGNRIRGAPVVPPDAIPDLPRLPLVVSVAGTEPRARIRQALAGMGRQEMQDFVCAA